MVLLAVCPEGVRIYNSNLDIWCMQHSFTLHLQKRWIHIFYALFHSHFTSQTAKRYSDFAWKSTFTLTASNRYQTEHEYCVNSENFIALLYLASNDKDIYTCTYNTDVLIKYRYSAWARIFCINLYTVRIVYSNGN